MKALGFLLSLVAVAALLAVPAAACTGITVKAQDGAVIHARTMEFALDLHSKVLIIPRGYSLAGMGPGDKPGLRWKAKYGAVGLNAFGLTTLTDGMNEKGLGAGMFYLPGFAQYQKVTPADQDKCLAPWDLVMWMLTNFTSVAEVRANLAKVKVWPATVAGISATFQPLHYLVTDREGNSLVVEYVGGRLHLYDNPMGVITNSPPFDWHLNNLRNYVNLSANDVPMLKLQGITLYPTGHGSGMMGLPGDVSPPSRFVRAVAFSQAALPAPDGPEGVMRALRLLNSFYISRGMARDWKNGKVSYGRTLWMDACDLKNLKFYFATYDNLTPKVVDMNKLDLGAAELRRIPMDSGPRFHNVTGLVK
ncbi:MAG: choloylglycine hydrolase family protein [Proteobacteria bacterium]|nr:choloylglycine hydrolase family protein [Pseudomonadota bacterium]MBU1451144.1 choloylglycine hydrolase family protein [Pseudomonadota bacterium]MBU2467437.1 choloylglycine hydrolase family protein [Pseudomonadota bacterium]MBU2516976.1 choloylglycine hydrolase family protein [Pseudomonadota bacterium]